MASLLLGCWVCVVSICLAVQRRCCPCCCVGAAAYGYEVVSGSPLAKVGSAHGPDAGGGEHGGMNGVALVSLPGQLPVSYQASALQTAV